MEKIIEWNSKFENSQFKVVEFPVKDLIQATNLDRFSARPNEFAKTLSFEDFLTKILSVRSKIGTKRIWFSSRSYYVCGLVLKYFLQSAENLWTLVLCAMHWRRFCVGIAYGGKIMQWLGRGEEFSNSPRFFCLNSNLHFAWHGSNKNDGPPEICTDDTLRFAIKSKNVFQPAAGIRPIGFVLTIAIP